jgi:hypothetical protein
MEIVFRITLLLMDIVNFMSIFLAFLPNKINFAIVFSKN